MLPLSYWHDSLEPGDELKPRASLAGDIQADVAIAGAGFSGLWTAYYLLKARPSLRVVIVEAETAGYGAAGRNGGWCVPETGTALDVLDKEGGAGTGQAMMRAMFRSVDEIAAVTQQEDIDCGYAKGGAYWFASDAAQFGRMKHRHAMLVRHGLGDAYQLLGPAETTAHMDATGIHGSIYTPNAAALHPARLARGIARAVERMGGTIYEKTPATEIAGRKLVTQHGTITADIVVRATEAYTRSLKGLKRMMVPLGNYVIATAPIPESIWAKIGLASRELFEDSPILLGYGQRTADGRIVWGGLGAPYWMGSGIPSSMRSPEAAERLRKHLVLRFPVLKDIEITHQWGGVMAMTRDMRSTIGCDRTTGEAWLGGFGGAGVAPCNAGGQALADLILGNDSELARFPWTNHRCRSWEPEPIRWLGIKGSMARYRSADRRARMQS